MQPKRCSNTPCELPAHGAFFLQPQNADPPEFARYFRFSAFYPPVPLPEVLFCTTRGSETKIAGKTGYSRNGKRWVYSSCGSALGASVGRLHRRQLHFIYPIAVGSYTPGPAPPPPSHKKRNKTSRESKPTLTQQKSQFCRKPLLST